MPARRTIIIDGDIVIYRVSEAVQTSYEVETIDNDSTDFMYAIIHRASKKQAKSYCDELIAKILKDCKGDEAFIALSDCEGNFRKDINPNYKSNRREIIKPVVYNYLREYVESKYRTFSHPKLEADDVIGILATSDEIIKGDKVIWSMDKDFKTIPCKFHKACRGGKDESIVVTKKEADWWWMYQTLVGDKTDGYSGCKNIGDKKAKKTLGDVGTKPLKEMWNIIIDSYLKAGLSEEDALMNARMARILRAEDYKRLGGKIILWTPSF